MAIRRSEIVAAWLAFLACLAIAIGLYISLSSFPPYSTEGQSLWPLPAAYFVELTLLALLALVCTLTDLPFADKVSWIVAGITLGFVILGVLSVGPAYLPVFIALVVLGVFQTRRKNGNLLINMGIGLLGMLVQMGLILLMIQVIG